MQNNLHSLREAVFSKANSKFKDKISERGNSWRWEDPEYHLRRMEEELYEFRQAIEHYEDPEQALDELADIVNFALFYFQTSKMEE